MTKLPGSGRRILVVDDEEGIVTPIVRYFRGLGCWVDAARESEEAEALVRDLRYDLVILDLRLTRLADADGLDVLREIRKRDDKTSVIVLSAYVSPEMEEEAHRSGADAVLRKPQRLPDLAQLAFALTERRS